MKILILSLLFLPFICVAQHKDTCLYNIDDELKTYVNIESSSLSTFQSNPSFFNYFVLFHYQNQEILNDISKQLSNRNYFGNINNFDFNAGTIINRNKKAGIFVSLRHLNYQILETTNDAFNLFIYGNASFAGNDAKFSNTFYIANSWQSAGAGFYQIVRLVNNSCLKYGFSLNYINAGSFNKLAISRGNIYTSAEGDTVNLQTTFSLLESKKGRFLSMRSAGSGFGINAFFTLKIRQKHHLDFKLNDIGLVNFNARKLYIDTFVKLNGIDILNGQSFDKATLPLDLMDTFIAAGNSYNKQSQMLAVNFSIKYRYSINDKFGIEAGISSVFDDNISPSVHASLCYFPVKPFGISAGFVKDNFNHYGALLQFNINLKNTMLKIGTFHAQQLVPDTFKGQHLSLSLVQLF